MPSPRTPTRPRFDIVALATSAGGLAALRSVLGALPAGFPVAVLVMQHLGRYGSALVEILGQHTKLPVCWVTDGACLVPGSVWVCPPQRMVDVGADGRCTVRAGVHRAMAHPIDALFGSLADQGGARVIAVVLTGLGDDGADGVRALAQAGAMVLAQSEATAEYPGMPRAASATGAVALVLPLDDIGLMLVRVVAGERLPRSSEELAARVALFCGHGAVVVGPLLADVDWEASSLGPVTRWAPELCAALRVALTAHVPALVHWGSELIEFYNDAALALFRPPGQLPTFGLRTGTARLGPPSRRMVQRVFRTGVSAFGTDPRPEPGDGAARERTLMVSSSAIRDPAAAHGVGGVLTLVTETVRPATGHAPP